ncbi:hypothetical protein [Nocardia sp. CDC160]|uniref:hypothetical protein n=1 Tax=Nocardia sp. CDC160 TaxID=3112166 RepID=UPI002DB70D96|nr:hypothetical protein [Nocardia sp. CDC160]MEC3913187.1 hypothetical protein [Nocardia sp. CDC160]
MDDRFDRRGRAEGESAGGRAPSPWWHHWVVAATVGGAIAAHSVLPAPNIAPMVLVITALTISTTKRPGKQRLSDRPTPRATLHGLALGGALLGLLGVGVIVESLTESRWTWVGCGVVAFTALMIAGPRLEESALRESSGRS